jgi:hypothetical protein
MTLDAFSNVETKYAGCKEAKSVWSPGALPVRVLIISTNPRPIFNYISQQNQTKKRR